MPRSLAQKRIARAEELAKGHVSIAEILRFYAEVTRLQGELRARFAKRQWPLPGSGALDLGTLIPIFSKFLDQLGAKGTAQIRNDAAEVKSGGQEKWGDLISVYWRGGDHDDPRIAFFSRAFL